MKKLIQRVRDWLIKKLGGYTAKEYDTINRIPFRDLTIDRRNVDHLKVGIKIPLNTIMDGIFPSSDFIKHELSRQLLPLVEERMKIMRITDGPNIYMVDSAVFEASIDVVRED